MEIFNILALYFHPQKKGFNIEMIIEWQNWP
jgi:hypothetical protein